MAFCFAAALALLLERFGSEFWAFFLKAASSLLSGRRPPRCHHVREGGLLAVRQGCSLGCCFCAASGLLFRVELCVFSRFLPTLLALPRLAVLTVRWLC